MLLYYCFVFKNANYISWIHLKNFFFSSEHIIEDIEGYEDLYEEKYKKIDSNYESEMIDCIPSFVKENYDYLLKDESNFEGAKNFSGLDDSGTDVLNQAYIETPPGDDIDGSKWLKL